MINRPLYIRKYHSGRLKEFGYKIENTFDESKESNEIIAVSDNQMLKTMRDIQKRTINKEKLEILIKTRDFYASFDAEETKRIPCDSWIVNHFLFRIHDTCHILNHTVC